MDRRSFLAALFAAPLIARPTLEEIERLTWRRRYWPGWSPSMMDTLYGRPPWDIESINPIDWICLERAHDMLARSFVFHRNAFYLSVPRIGDTIDPGWPENRFVFEAAPGAEQGKLILRKPSSLGRRGDDV